MQKILTILFAFAIFVLIVGWAITPAQADCPHRDDPNHRHCQGVSEGDGDIMIVDSSDPPKQVGKFIDFSNEGVMALVAFNAADGRTFVLSVNRTGFTRGRLFFTSRDCGDAGEDDALEEVPSVSIVPRAVVNGPGNTVYLERAGSFANRFTGSELTDDGVTCKSLGVSQNNVIMDPIANSDDLFTLPFKIVGDAPSLP